MSFRTILFDLDDTLFDYQHGRRCGLRALQGRYPVLQRVPLTDLELKHDEQLKVDYPRLLDGSLSVEESRVRRIRSLCQQYGLNLDERETLQASQHYESHYQANRRSVPGAIPLLRHLRGKMATGIVTNGLSVRQREKIEVCELGSLIDEVVISEEIGVAKPDSRIFMEALRRLQSSASEALFVGDSWVSDILGANDCGMRTIWLNRYEQRCPDPTITVEIRAFEPVEEILGLLVTNPHVT